MIRVTPLGAGQDVGRSCILVTIMDKTIMFDCGMHMGYNDHRRFPDFALAGHVDLVIISHFHLDHCGSLPLFAKSYKGPIYMTFPTKAIAPILLEDMRKIAVEKKGQDLFTSQDIKDCMRRVTACNINQVIQVTAQIQIKAYYAGHVLGAAMFHVKVTDIYGESASVVYTGDYNMTPDRHLGPAWIDPCEPDLIITESTYATTIRDSKRSRERDFLKKVHDCVSRGGKVLIPVFALGRAQELLILIESYWQRMADLSAIPVYFSAGMTERANEYYKLFLQWTNSFILKTFYTNNVFDFVHVKTWDQSLVDNSGPMVLFASPGMLHAGTSLTVFTKWCADPKNMVILPGYCVAGTVGAKVLAGEKTIDIDRVNTINVALQVKHLSFSAHADAKGIIQLIRMSKAKRVLLVHGEKAKMASLKQRILDELGVPCYDPANGSTVLIETSRPVQGMISRAFDNKLQIHANITHSPKSKIKYTLQVPLDKKTNQLTIPVNPLNLHNDKLTIPNLQQVMMDKLHEKLTLHFPYSIEYKNLAIRAAQFEILIEPTVTQTAPLSIQVSWASQYQSQVYQILAIIQMSIT